MQKKDVKQLFGTSVRAWRSRKAFSQEKLAERAGLHRTYISDVERGARNLSLESINRLARALEISIPSLFSCVGTKPEELQASLSQDELVDILLVEDNLNDAELTMQALKSAGIFNRIFIAHDGMQALDFLFCTGEFAHRKPCDRPQLILLDLNLPKIEGLEVLRRVKADPKTNSIPVIVLTVSADDRNMVLSKKLGAEGYIVKPVDFQNLSEVTPKLCLQWALLKPPVLSRAEKMAT